MNKSITLYHYIHCPFCIRVRLVLNYLKVKYTSIPLPYDDELTPIGLTGIKMLPILVLDGRPMNESMDIIKKVDASNCLNINLYENQQDEIEKILSDIGKSLHPMAMPYWVYTPEFDSSSREYFQKKKEQKRGPFNELVNNRKSFEAKLNQILGEVESNISTWFNNDRFSVLDVLLYSHIVGAYVVPGFQLTEKVFNYLKRVEKIAGISYHGEFWEDNKPFSERIRHYERNT